MFVRWFTPLMARWFTPQESKGVLAIVGSLIIGSIVLFAGRSVPEIRNDIVIQTEAEHEAAQDTLFELGGSENDTKKPDENKIRGKSSKGNSKKPTAKPKAKLENASIDLNKGTIKQFSKLPGIGPSKAKAIIEYRDKNGGFKNIKDITKVKGIGPKTYENLKVYLTIE